MKWGPGDAKRLPRCQFSLLSWTTISPCFMKAIQLLCRQFYQSGNCRIIILGTWITLLERGVIECSLSGKKLKTRSAICDVFLIWLPIKTSLVLFCLKSNEHLNCCYCLYFLLGSFSVKSVSDRFKPLDMLGIAF